MKNALVILADGFEEMEAVTPIDLLRRAAVTVTVAGLDAAYATGSHDIHLSADTCLNALDSTFDALILPGGPGTSRLLNSPEVLKMVQDQFLSGRLIAAICAAPSVLGAAGILKNKKATCFPGIEEKLGGAQFLDQKVVTDGNIITSRGAGTAIEFSLAIVEYLVGRDVACSVAKKILFT